MEKTLASARVQGAVSKQYSRNKEQIFPDGMPGVCEVQAGTFLT